MNAKVTFQGAIYEILDGESLLEALLRGGADVPFSCRKGSCHTCMMRTLDPAQAPAEAQRGLRPAMAESGHFLPCITHPSQDLNIGVADRSVMFIDAIVASKEQLSPRIVRLLLEPELAMDWTPGQYINLRAPSGLIRSYSIASISHQDYFIELHVGLVEGGQVSTWVHEQLQEGDCVQLQGPVGQCVYDERLSARALLLISSGTGLAPIVGIVRDAIERGHQGPIDIIHAASSPQEAYLKQSLETLAGNHDHVSFEQLEDGRDLVAHCFDARPELGGTVLYLCGNPEMVYKARVRAIESGVNRHDIFADPFEDAHPYWPQDREKLEAWPTEPELWEALGQGELLREILVEFYDAVYEDERLSPFFHNVTKARAIYKQHEFLYDVFSGEIEFFGLKPFNAHHWMIISDELFNYREDLFESVVRRHGLEERLVRRWMAFQELFRRELVKSNQRGMIIDGKEVSMEGFSQETLMMDMICDGCNEEMLEGSVGRMHKRTGQLFCERCGSKPQIQTH